MLEALERLGGNVHCASSRESIMYQAAVFNKDVSSMVGILAETVRDPLITEEEVDQQRDTAAYEIGEIWAKPELIMPELVHMTAYENNTLGNPLLCPRERLDHIDKAVVDEYRALMYRPERMVVALAGVEHDTAVKLAEQYFGDMPTPAKPAQPAASPRFPLSSLFASLPGRRPPAAAAAASTAPVGTHTPAHYTGGFRALSPDEKSEYLHVQIAFEGLAITDPDIYALAALQTLLGGGGSFSAGGPGKGMYSRLYTNVLNHFGWIESCVAFNHSYTDSGLFGIAGSCRPDACLSLVAVMLQELEGSFSRLGSDSRTHEEVERAKNQLRSSLLMNLESRMVELEDLGRQVQLYGHKIPVLEMSAKIAQLKPRDLARVAERVLKGRVLNAGKGTGKPTIVVQGPAESSEEIIEMVSDRGLGRSR